MGPSAPALAVALLPPEEEDDDDEEPAPDDAFVADIDGPLASTSARFAAITDGVRDLLMARFEVRNHLRRFGEATFVCKARFTTLYVGSEHIFGG